VGAEVFLNFSQVLINKYTKNPLCRQHHNTNVGLVAYHVNVKTGMLRRVDVGYQDTEVDISILILETLGNIFMLSFTSFFCKPMLKHEVAQKGRR